jgi:Cu+-exporting ATPase
VFRQRLVIIPPVLRTALEDFRRDGYTAVVVAWDGQAKAVVAVADQPKPTSAEAIASLRLMGLAPVLLTGDNIVTAEAVAASVGIDTDEHHLYAGVMPDDKVAVVRDLQERGYAVAMVGDGVNDAAALAQADVGLAMGSGTDVAMQASDLTIVNGDLRSVPDAIRLSRATLRTIRTNVFWAFAYNVAAIPLAASGRLNPMWAGLAMASSSVFVVTNSLRLRRIPLHR